MDSTSYFLNLNFEKEPNWLITLFPGALVGAIFGSYSQFWNLFTFVFRYIFIRSRYEGIWYTYHWTFIKYRPEIVTSDVIIKKGITSTYKFILNQRGTNLAYNGQGYIEGSHLVFKFKSSMHEEKMVCRFQDILGSKDLTPGLWLSYDHDKNVAAGGIILSNKEIPEAEINKVLKQSIKTTREAALMHVNLKAGKNERHQSKRIL